MPIKNPTFQPSFCTAVTKLTVCPSFQSFRTPTQVPTKIRAVNVEKSTNNDAANDVGVITGISIGGGFALLGLIVLVIYLWTNRKANKPTAAKIYVADSNQEAEGAHERDVEEGDSALYDVMDINIELSDDDKGNDANSDDNIIIESKLDNEKNSTINTITVKDSHMVDHWFVMDSDNDENDDSD